MEFYQIIILSIVEGITEFLPISSTAHLILTSQILSIPKTDFLSTFEISIQVGAIGAVAYLYLDKIRKQTSLLYKACIGFIPTGILGLLFYKYIKLFFNEPIVPIIALFVGGIAIIGIELYFKKKLKSAKKAKSLTNMTYKDALLIGLMQSISMIPGVSRAAASIFGGMVLKFDRKSAVEFSFLLAIPTLMAATILDLSKTGPNFSNLQIIQLLLGIVLSFISALFVIKWLVKFVQQNNFILFGIYRIVLSVIYYLLFLR